MHQKGIFLIEAVPSQNLHQLSIHYLEGNEDDTPTRSSRARASFPLNRYRAGVSIALLICWRAIMRALYGLSPVLPLDSPKPPHSSVAFASFAVWLTLVHCTSRSLSQRDVTFEVPHVELEVSLSALALCIGRLTSQGTFSSSLNRTPVAYMIPPRRKKATNAAMQTIIGHRYVFPFAAVILMKTTRERTEL